MNGETAKTMRLDGFMTVRRFKQLVEQEPNNEAYRFSLGKAYFDLGQYPDAIAELEAALGMQPEWCAVCILLGKAYTYMMQRDAALAYFTRALELALEQNHLELREEIMHLMRALG